MRDIALLLAVAGATLTIVAGAVFGLGDRETLVPPPEAVVESFTRALVEERYDIAVNYLARELQARTDAAALRARFEPTWLQLGTPNQVSADQEWIQDGAASARARVDAESGAAMLQFRLVREGGLWRIGQLPERIETVVK